MSTRNLTSLRIVSNPVQQTGPEARAVTHIYKPFFLSGVLCVLTAGCLLGAVALAGIALQGSYTASTWTPYVLAHANSQLYGWVGLFVMGFALQQHAPRVGKLPLFYKLANLSLALMLVAIICRFFAEPIVYSHRSLGLGLGIASSSMQVTAVVLFMANIGLTRYSDGSGLTWQTKFVFASLGWWMLVAIVEPFYFALSHQADSAASTAFVAQYFPPYREAQFLGFVAMMIFGVALVKLNTCFGVKEADKRFGNAGFILWTIGLVSRMSGWVVYYRYDMAPVSSWLYTLGGGLLAASAVILIKATRIFEPLNSPIRSHKFIRAAFAWLLIGGLLLLLEPLHLALTRQQFSHAYIGAIRHAVTVGFISQMIIGVGTHVVAAMNDFDVQRLRPLWTVFWLLNIGNALRVVLEIATDYTGVAFLPMGVTGFIELTALVIWALDVFLPVLRLRRLSHA